MRYVSVLLVAAILLAAYSCERWKWQECRAVGHSRLYCASKVGE